MVSYVFLDVFPTLQTAGSLYPKQLDTVLFVAAIPELLPANCSGCFLELLVLTGLSEGFRVGGFQFS